MAVPADAGYLTAGIALLGAAVVAVPLFRRLGLGIVLGYLAAGLAIGPWGLGVFSDPDSVLHIAELGVVFLLFIIGLELSPARLWTMRRDIFGFGTAQVAVCGVALSALGLAAGLDWRAALIAGFGLALSSTAFALQLLQERGQLRTNYGRKTFAVLLFQDLCIVPLLLLVPLLAPAAGGEADYARQAGLAIAALAGVVLAGKFLLNPLFGLLARADAREVMTAAALLVVVGAAYVMQLAGLSMALGAFLAGVLLADSSYRHQLEMDIEPFRILLLGLFFIAVGMSIDLGLVAREWLAVLVGVPVVMALKGGVIWALARMFGQTNADAMRIALTIPQGGEFAFVLFGAALAAGIMQTGASSLLSAIVVVTMAATPLVCGAYDGLAARLARGGVPAETVESFEEANARVVIIGFGRFGQMVAQMLMAEGIDIVAVDRDPKRIDAARRFGYQVYYGDAMRADLLRNAGARSATLIALCMDSRDAVDKAAGIMRKAFPETPLFCRAQDRDHFIELERLGVDFAVRETFESALAFGRATLEHVGIPGERITALEADVRQRDEERLRVQMDGGDMAAGLEILHRRTPRPAKGDDDVSA